MLTLVPFVLGTLLAQQADQTIFRTQTRLVVLHATAEDKEGHLMMELPKSAFQIFENGVKQEIKSFRHEDVPVSLGLIIDSSASMTNKRDRVAAYGGMLDTPCIGPRDRQFDLVVARCDAHFDCQAAYGFGGNTRDFCRPFRGPALFTNSTYVRMFITKAFPVSGFSRWMRPAGWRRGS